MDSLSSFVPGLNSPHTPNADTSSPQGFPPAVNFMNGVVRFQSANEYGFAPLNPHRISPLTLGTPSEPASPAGSIQESPLTPVSPSKRSMAERTSPIPLALSQVPVCYSRSMEDVLANVKTQADYILKEHAHKLDKMESDHLAQKLQLKFAIFHMEERLADMQQLFGNNEKLISQLLRERETLQALPPAKRKKIKNPPPFLHRFQASQRLSGQHRHKLGCPTQHLAYLQSLPRKIIT